jgi:16S rRNA (guanine527-N7)-methyltransferase
LLSKRTLSLPTMLDAARITTLLQPFQPDVSPELALQLQTYLDLLLRWNARINLTAIRDPEEIVTRHFGESFFAARLLRDAGAFTANATLADVGSGAGFPGIPIQLFAPELRVTLIESQNKKATFLREVVRALDLSHTVVHAGRAENWARQADIVTLRAVEKFASALPVAAGLVAPGGKLCLLVGEVQAAITGSSLGSNWRIADPIPTPLSDGRAVLVAERLE